MTIILLLVVCMASLSSGTAAAQDQIGRIRNFMLRNSQARTCLLRVHRGDRVTATMSFLTCALPNGTTPTLVEPSSRLGPQEDVPFVTILGALRADGYKLQFVSPWEVFATK